MKTVVTGSEMKAIDTYTIQELAIPSLVLMERAALSMVCRMRKEISKADRILCICGAGNNGGDAVAVARILFGQGYASAIYMAGIPEKWTEETKKQIQIARNVGVPEYNELDLRHIRVVVDGIFGIGLSKSVREPYHTMINKLNAWREGCEHRSIWAVDVPSGLSSDTGQVLGCAVKADATVTFGYIKRGMLLYPGRDFAGKCYVEDIGFPKKSLDMNPVLGFTCDVQDFEQLPERKNDSNKGSYGKILIIAGSKNMSGAAYFAGRAAYVSGAGLVRILAPEANRTILQTQLPQAMISVWEEMDEASLADVLHWADALVIGPGVGTEGKMAENIEKVLRMANCPVVMDADGLNLLAEYESWYPLLEGHTVVTPHMGEMARLTGKTIEALKADRAGAAIEYARSRKLVCVLKDSSTVVSDGRQVYFNCNGNHGMATGGSGDILAGVIGAFLGAYVKEAGMDCGAEENEKDVCSAEALFKAAYMGVYFHGCAGDAAAKCFSARGMTSVEIIEGLLEVYKGLN